jgi:hypothetical protein
MTVLYVNAKGRPVSTHSYSGGNEYKFCRRKYRLSRIDGWKEVDEKASKEFGKCLEDALSFWHSNDMKAGSCAEEFRRLFQKHKENPKLVYTDKEGSFEDLMQMGSEMCRLYEIRWPSFGLSAPRFQLNYEKHPFPGTELAQIKYTAWVDMRATVNELYLTPEESPKPIIIDIKTSAVRFPDEKGMLRLDGQLKSYAWVSGIPDVGFLVFVKARPNSFKKGDEVSVLSDASASIHPGDSAVVLFQDDEFNHVYVVRESQYQAYEDALKGLKGKALEAKKQEMAESLDAQVFTAEGMTKQRIQFLTDRIPDEDIQEAGEIVGRDIVNIVQSSKDNFFPKDGGVRFPDQKCTWCAYLGICSGNPALRDQKLVQIGQEDWLQDLET